MKFQCLLCKEITELEEFGTGEAGLTIRCRECGDEFFLPSPGMSERPAGESSEVEQCQAMDGALPLEAESGETYLAAREGAEAGRRGRDRPGAPWLAGAEFQSREMVGLGASGELPAAEEQGATADSLAAVEAAVPARGGEEAEGEPTERVPTPDLCPKCGDPQSRETDSCAKCGLVFANIGVTFHPNVPEDPEPEVDEALRLWAAIEEQWEDEERHEAFLGHCVAAGQAELASRKYNERLEASGGTDEDARRRLQKVVAGVQAMLVQSATPQEETQRMQRQVRAILYLLIVVLALAAIYVVWSHWGAGMKSPAPGL